MIGPISADLWLVLGAASARHPEQAATANLSQRVACFHRSTLSDVENQRDAIRRGRIAESMSFDINRREVVGGSAWIRSPQDCWSL